LRGGGALPATVTTIDRDQRVGLYELVRNHLGSIENFFVALERTKDFAMAELAAPLVLKRSVAQQPVYSRDEFARRLLANRAGGPVRYATTGGEIMSAL